MRKIKFRVWDIFNKNYFNSKKFLIDLDGNLHITSGVGYCDEKHILQQFTGLKDKNEKEIYEGDIIKYQENNYICLDNGVFSTDGTKDVIREIIWNPECSIGLLGMNLCKSHFKTLEIIGNIFENPELLK